MRMQDKLHPAFCAEDANKILAAARLENTDGAVWESGRPAKYPCLISVHETYSGCMTVSHLRWHDASEIKNKMGW